MAAMFTIDVITLFPEIFAPMFGLSIVGRAVERGLVRVGYHHLLEDLAGGERADAPPYGGGPGMVMRLEPIVRALDAILAEAPPTERRAIVLTSPAGAPFRQPEAERLARLDHLIVVCGHYEDIDGRLGDLYPLDVFSIGDFVLTGGEIPALAMIDATVRLLDGAIRPESLAFESFSEDGLDFPAYTRPPVFRGVSVPEVLLSGDHAKIAAWRREQSQRRGAERAARLRDETLHHDEGP
jgi:tRNA (guanine37-N1)-methyltransferase